MTMKRILLTWILLGTLCVWGGCNRTKPQTPANRPVKDTVTMGLMSLNQRYVQEATKQLETYVKNASIDYLMNEMGYWYHVQEAGNGPLATEMEKLTIHRREFALADTLTLYKDEVLQVRPAKREIMDAIDQAFEHLHIGDSVSLLVPWYLAYGPKGDGGDILPYTSIRVELRILKE